MRFCSNCGSSLNGEKFCTKCGFEIIEKDNDEKCIKKNVSKQIITKKTNKALKVSIVVLCLFLISSVGGYFVYSKYQDDIVEKEKKAEEQKSTNINKTNINSQFAGISLFENGKYAKYLDIIGTPLALVSVDYNNELNNGVLDVKRLDRASIPNDKTNSVNWMQIKLDVPLNSEALLSTMSDLPLMKLDSGKGYFIEEDVNLANGHTVNIYYYIDQTTLSIYNVLITEFKLD